MTSLAHSPTNDTRMADLLSEVRELGRHHAEGEDAMPALAIRVTRAAYDGVITLDKDRDGKDDAARIYDEYVKSKSKKAAHTHTSNGTKANVSKLRTFVKASVASVEKNGDFVTVLDRAFELHKEQAKVDIKTVQPPYAAAVSVARKALEEYASSGAEIGDDAIREAIAKPPSPDKTVERELEAIQKKLENLITGEKGVKDQDDRVLQAHDLVKERLAQLVLDRETSELDAKLAARGLKVVPAVTTQVTDTTGFIQPGDEAPATPVWVNPQAA